ncbi:flocculation suppression protein [Lasallia pustulata]|uniref:Flocculation suppression protein n=1 Tax=Lasallia pustulata TaxID=136370 RepID=A0A1W5CX90_9LECA|nr:flocculation suppression protein [Lasallia pustulata]
MDVTPPTSTSMGPPMNSSPETDQGGGSNHVVHSEAAHMPNGSGNALSAAAAASSQQPKVVQTAFIHKLYNMLEDPNIQHLISWSNTNESFVMSPSQDFSKVLAQYFKHTNISSFVRQLNMYGFHKVSDVFHTGSPDSTLWEFKHGNGNFKRGDLIGLREIKRRASRHALIHRDSFPTNHKPSVSQPGTPAEPMPDMGDVRLASIEHSLCDMRARLVRTEESNTALITKCQALTDSLIKCHQWSNDVSQYIMAMIPDHESQLHRDVAMMQKDIASQLDVIRNLDDPHESLLSGRQPYFSNMAIDSAPLSPRQVAQDDRRPSLHGIPPRPILFRPPVPPHLAISPRRYGSIGTGNPSPNYQRPAHPQPPPPPPPHPLASVSPPPGSNLARRHTSADIRVPNWPGQQVSPFASGQSSSQWPSSPDRTPHPQDQQVRDVLAQYEIGGPRNTFASRQTTPPLTNDTTPSTYSGEAPWPFGGPKLPPRHLDSAPQTRRSSMASNVHSLLNPAETVERDEDDAVGDDRKRKRMQ